MLDAKERNRLQFLHDTLELMTWHHIKKLQEAQSSTLRGGQIQFKRWDIRRLKLWKVKCAL